MTAFACLQAAAMVHLYRAERGGAWPDDLSSVGQIPLDPWDGRPLRYRHAEGDRPAFVYSVGPNLVDDGGKARKPYGTKADKGDYDFLFPLGRWPNDVQEGHPPR